MAGMSDEEVMEYETICQHEVAHGVMRWMLGHVATEIWATPTEGYCAGTGKHIRTSDALLIVLAGYAHEIGILPTRIDWDNTHDDDFDVARGCLEPWHERIGIKDGSVVVLSMNDALEKWLGRAAGMLFPHYEFIERAGLALMERGRLSARSFAAMLRNYNRELKSEGRDRFGERDNAAPAPPRDPAVVPSAGGSAGTRPPSPPPSEISPPNT